MGVKLLLVLAAVFLVAAGFGGKLCPDQKFHLLSLLNLLCNNTQTINIAMRDACYQCFFRTAPMTSGETLMLQLSQCAFIYLNNTNYAPCALQIASFTSGARPVSAPTTRGCFTGYCDFVQCIRRVNTRNLVDQCLQNSLLNLNLALQRDRFYLYTNTSACLLANARCSSFNPITGLSQGFDPLAQVNLANSQVRPNSLQITSNGDVRVVSLPRNTKSFVGFCTRNGILDQASGGVCL